MSTHSLILTCDDNDDDAAGDYMSLAMDLMLTILNRNGDFGALEPWLLEYKNTPALLDDDVVWSTHGGPTIRPQVGDEEMIDPWVPDEDIKRGDR